ncbi:MAG: sigma-54 dependent transcriptional regulator [Balneolaceae bacterium]
MNQTNGHILILDDDVDVLNAARLLLKQHLGEIDVERNPKYLESLISAHRYDALLLDMNFTGDTSSGEEGFYWLEQIRKLDPDLSVILITAYGDIEKAVRAMKNGAADFIMKPWENEKLVATVTSAVNLTQSRRQVDLLQEQQRHLSSQMDHAYQDMIGQSEQMQRVFRTIEKVAGTDANVLILGENGTGKELVARALHRRSARRDQVFISVDIGAIPESLFESELFGHTQGAFTDARKEKAGRFEVASGGTLFLDEIGNTPLQLQPKLLSALETRSITRVGSTRSQEIDIRLISATNSSVHEMVENQEFRQDLLYRINTIEIKLPALRDRVEDIPLLTKHFLEQFALKYRKDNPKIENEAIKKLTGYHWPGNIRELQHVIERAVILSESDHLTPDDFLLRSQDSGLSGQSIRDLTLSELEKLAVKNALEKHEGNISQAADELGLTRASLYRRIDKYGL